MYTKEAVLLNQEGFQLYNNFSSYDQQDDYYKKMVEIKDKNIEDLLRELKETKEIYQEYKLQYLNEEKRLKAKFTEIAAKFDAQSSQLEKHKQLNAKLKSQIEANAQKEKKSTQLHQNQMRELKNKLIQHQSKNKEFMRDKTSTTQKCEMLQEKCGKLQEKLRKKQTEMQIYERQASNLREELLEKQRAWSQEKRHLTDKIQEQERKRVAKHRANHKLDDLENRIRNTLMKI